VILHPGIYCGVPGDARFYYLRFDTNTNAVVSEAGSPLFGYSSAFSTPLPHYGTSYGYSTVLGYYQFSGNANICTANIRSSRDVRKDSVAANAGNTDYTEAQWFAGSGYDISVIANGQTGLAVAIKPYPVFIGGYQINVAETLLPLLPNRLKQNIYLLKTDDNRLSNRIYSSLEDEPSGFTKQLIATVVTDDEKVTSAKTFSIGVSIPPNDSGAIRYLSNVDGECGWVTGASIVGTGGGITTSYSLPTASTTVLGGVKVDGTTISISSGVISAASTGVGVGIGQTWQDFTAITGVPANDRIFGVTYTNSTGKPIMVIVQAEGLRVGGGKLEIGTLSLPISNIDFTQPYTFIVPDQITYSFSLGNRTGGFWWIELR
jgi:hypothetical protein